MAEAPKQLNSTWRQRGEFLILMTAIHLLDNLVSDNLTKTGALSDWGIRMVAAFEYVGGIALLMLGIACFLTLVKQVKRLIVPMVTVYLSFAFVHLIVNVAAILLTADMRRGQSLLHLWDVATVYFMSVALFTAWYWFLDSITPDGAFAFPPKPDGRASRTLIDYLFLSFNTSATFGPTTETPTSHGAKLLMMLQVCISLLVLMVLLARALTTG